MWKFVRPGVLDTLSPPDQSFPPRKVPGEEAVRFVEPKRPGRVWMKLLGLETRESTHIAFVATGP